MVSSYLPELFGMCDTLAVMSRGRLSAVCPIEEWTPESVMQAAIGIDETLRGSSPTVREGAIPRLEWAIVPCDGAGS